MDITASYIPIDRRLAMVQGQTLSDRTEGSALFADISGFTPLTAAFLKEFGPNLGPAKLTRQLNLVYDAMIGEVHCFGGSVIGFSGDAITCWFDGDNGQQAIACGLVLQKVMKQFAQVQTPKGTTVSLAIKVAVSIGSARRFRVGTPRVQYIDVLAGSILDRMAEAEKCAGKGEVVVVFEGNTNPGYKVEVTEWREKAKTEVTPQVCTRKEKYLRFAVVSGLTLSSPILQTSWQADELALTETQIRPWLLSPIYERLKGDQSRFLAEIRPVVALFMRFGGIEYDTDEAAGGKLDTYIKWVQTVVTRYEGYLLQLTFGDKGCYFYIAFGAPVAHDDDSARAVAVAMILRSPPKELDFVGDAQIGISRGRMRAGAYGGSTRRTYGVLGDEVNMAARLMDKAEQGQILVSKRIADATERWYHFNRDQPYIKVKGKDNPIPVAIAVDKRPPPMTIFTSLLVGREAELTRLYQILERVSKTEGQIVRLEGVAGIGKSHLSAEFIERALTCKFRVVVGICQSTTQRISYYPWRQAFRALFELTDEPLAKEDKPVWVEQQLTRIKTIVEERNPGWLIRLPLLEELLGLPVSENKHTSELDPRLRREFLLTLVVEIVQSWASTQPLLLLIEDVHWIDEASRELMLTLGRTITGLSVLLAVVHRPPKKNKPLLPELDKLPGYHHINLSKLTPSGVANLVTNRLSGQISPLALSLIQIRVEGNPFFTEEVVDSLREGGGLYCRDDGIWDLSQSIVKSLRETHCLTKENGNWILVPAAPLHAANIGLPNTIWEIVLSRIGRLPENYQLTLKVAGVIGRVFEFYLLNQSFPAPVSRDTLLAQVKVMEDQDLIRLETSTPQLTYMFKHNITQEVVYDTLLDQQQTELHRNVGEALENWQPNAVERLAYYFYLSDANDKKLFYLDKAAHKTQWEYANETALTYYDQALGLEERWEWLKGKVEVLHLLGLRKDEEAVLKVLTAIPDAPIDVIAVLQGQYYEATSQFAEARAAIEQALVASKAQNNLTGEMRSLTRLGSIAWRQGNYDQAKVWFNQVLQHFEQGEIYAQENEFSLINAFNGRGTVFRQQGQFERAGNDYENALILCRKSNNRLGEAMALNNLGIAAYYQRQFAEAEQYSRQALQIRRAIGDRAGEGNCLLDLANVVGNAGDYAQSLRYYQESLVIQQAIGNRWEQVNLWNSIGVIYLELGDFYTAQISMQRGMTLACDIGDEVGRAYLLSNLGLAACDTGQLDRAETLLSEGLDYFQAEENKYEMSFFLSYLSMASLEASRYKEAIARAAEALALRQQLNGMQLNITDNMATLAAAHLAAGNLAKAMDYARQTLAILKECDGQGPEFPQRDYFIGYQVLTAAGQHDSALEALQSAYNLVTAKAEKITDPILRRSFLEKVAINRRIVMAMECSGQRSL